ncbi:MAG: zinc ribbon domain-containing protein, partial [Deltaproteobacteria bacterium]|nr:zinc ribbon domain-containing protein [Deltaproteobacteria bacterium]
DEVEKAEEKARKEAEKKVLENLRSCRESKDVKTILQVFLNVRKSALVRKTAASYLGELGDLNCIEPIRNHTFHDPEVQESAEHAIELIHKANFTKECPYCAEIIKARAKVCKHCNREL